ncbi:MAG: hypothetical protein HY347_12080 [candidate division NC10 bacterium]|nr:hypothetical protein [candidate division NC10 bacterium]
MTRRVLGGVLILLILLEGCGYTFLTAPSTAGKKLALLDFRNTTAQPGIEGMITAALLERLAASGINVVPEKEAELLLGGEVTGYETSAVAFSQADIGSRFRLHLLATITLKEAGKDGPLLREQVVGEAFYLASPELTATKGAEAEAVLRASQDLGQRIVDRVVEAFLLSP